MLYPRTLNRLWYIRDVSHHVISSVRGAANYYAGSIENQVNRTAFLEMAARCLEVCRANQPDLNKMLETLSWLKWSLKFDIQPWVFSLQRWRTNKTEYREKAVDQAIELVSSYKAKYIDGNSGFRLE